LSRKRARSCSASAASAARLGLILLAAALAPAGAAAQQWTLVPGVQATQDYDDNVFANDDDEESSWITTVRPSVELRRSDDQGELALFGNLTSRTYWRFSEINGLDRRYGARFDRQLTPRFRLRLRASEAVLDDSDQVFEDAPEGPELIEGGRPDITDREAELGADYALTPRTGLVGSARINDTRYEESSIDRDLQDSRDLSAMLGIQHLLSPRDRVSLFGTTSRTNAEPISSAIDFIEENNDVQSLQLGWQREWSPLWRSQVAFGYSWLRSEVENFPTLVGCDPFEAGCLLFISQSGVAFARVAQRDFSDRESGTVGSVEIRRLLKRGELSVGYEREIRSGGPTSSTAGAGFDSDSVWAEVHYQLTQRLDFNLDLIYYDLKSPNDIGGNRRIDAEQFRSRLRLDWRVRKNLFLFGELLYFDQDSENRRLDSFTRKRAGVGLRYSFDLNL
jgi:hypothetical protein